MRKGARCALSSFHARQQRQLTPHRRYTDAVERHFRASVLDALPPQYNSLLQQIEDEDAGASYDMSAHARGCQYTARAPDAHAPALVPEPNLDGHVFCRVKEDKGDIEIDECAPAASARAPAAAVPVTQRRGRDKNVELFANDLLIIRYRPIREFVEEESVELV